MSRFVRKTPAPCFRAICRRKLSQDLREVQVIDADGVLADASPGRRSQAILKLQFEPLEGARQGSIDKISGTAAPKSSRVRGMSFGIRNVPDRAKALMEMRRVLVPSEQSRALRTALSCLQRC